MFVRFRPTARRLQVSLVETRRVEGKVRHEHIGALGSIETPQSVEGRIAFWQRLHERLAKLGNRVDPTTQGKVLGDVHARIPMVTLDQQRALQLERAEADERFWGGLRDMHQEQVEGHGQLVATADAAIAHGKAAAGAAAAKATAAKDRVERLKRGDDVPGGIGKAFTREDFERICRENGIDPEHCVRVNDICNALGFETLMKVITTEKDRAERAAVRALHRRVAAADDE